MFATGLVAWLAYGTLSCAAQKVVWGGFTMPRARSGCFLETDSMLLERELQSFGWRANGHNYPDIAWDRHMVAIVVPTRDEALKPTSVGISGGQVVVHLSSSEQPYDGIVLQIPESYGRLAKCRLRYTESDIPDGVYPMIVVAASVDSITPDDPDYASGPAPPDENHELPSTATLQGTEAPE
jgi:hypothetical protein